MHNISNRVPDKKVSGQWLTNCPVDLGELYLFYDWDLLNPRAAHSSSSDSKKSIIKNRNSTRNMLSPCLTPILKSMDISTLPMMIFHMLLL